MNKYELANGYVPDAAIKKYFKEEVGLGETEDPTKAFFMLRDGTMISGVSEESELEQGERDIDHNIAVDLVSEGNKLHGVHSAKDVNAVWPAIHEKTGMLRMVPETNQVLAGNNQALTERQSDTLDEVGLGPEKLEFYCETKPNINLTTEDIAQKNRKLAKVQEEAIKNIKLPQNDPSVEMYFIDFDKVDLNDYQLKRSEFNGITPTPAGKAISQSMQNGGRYGLYIMNDANTMDPDIGITPLEKGNMKTLATLKDYELSPTAKDIAKKLIDNLPDIKDLPTTTELDDIPTSFIYASIDQTHQQDKKMSQAEQYAQYMNQRGLDR